MNKKGIKSRHRPPPSHKLWEIRPCFFLPPSLPPSQSPPDRHLAPLVSPAGFTTAITLPCSREIEGGESDVEGEKYAPSLAKPVPSLDLGPVHLGAVAGSEDDTSLKCHLHNSGGYSIEESPPNQHNSPPGGNILNNEFILLPSSDSSIV